MIKKQDFNNNYGELQYKKNRPSTLQTRNGSMIRDQGLSKGKRNVPLAVGLFTCYSYCKQYLLHKHLE